jgi:hypothetical protein
VFGRLVNDLKLELKVELAEVGGCGLFEGLCEEDIVVREG